MDIFQLEYALAVARYQHFTQAADEICISQSALSHQISKLEEELGVQLFRRTTRAVQLTPAGKEFIKYAEQVLANIAQTKHAMRQYASAERGELALGTIPTIGLLGLTATIADFQSQHPSLQLSIREEYSEKLLDMLQSFEIDAALLTPPTDLHAFASVNFYSLINDRLVLVVPPDHPLAHKKIIDLQEARHEKFVFMNANSNLRAEALEVCRSAGFEPTIILQSRQVETVLGFVSAGLGVTLIAYRVAKFLKKSSYVLVNFHNAPKRVTSLAILKDNAHLPAIQAFCAFMREQYREK